MSLKWNGDAAKKLVHQEMANRVEAAAIVVQNRAKELVGEEGYGSPAPHGSPPHKQTGRGQSSITREVDRGKLEARVGTNVFYMRIHEMKNHPWLRRALLESRVRIDAIFARKMH